MMPRLDGIELVTALRHTVKYQNLPVIVMSAFGSGNLQEAVKAGADKAMRKPINFEKFFRSIETLLH